MGILDHLELIGDGIHARRQSARERDRLAHFRYDNDPDDDIRPDQAARYDQAMQERDKQDHSEQELSTSHYAMLGANAAMLAEWFGSLPTGGLLTPLVLAADAGIGWWICHQLAEDGRTWRNREAKRAARRGDTVPDDPNAPLTATLVTTWLRDAGVIGANDHASIEDEGGRDAVSKWVPVVLSGGATVSRVRERLESLGAAVDVNPAQIMITSGWSPARFTLRVFNTLPFTGASHASPVLAGDCWNVRRNGVPIGLTLENTPISVDFTAGRHALVVASSGNGKSVFLQTMLCAIALDPTATFDVLDGKPDGSFSSFRNLARGFITIVHDGWEIRAAELMERVAAEVDQRAAMIERGESPGGDHFVVIDEFQEFTGSSNGAGMKVGEPRYRFRAALEKVARKGRSVGVHLVLASQDYDGRTLDGAVLGCVGIRIVGWAPSDMSRSALGEAARVHKLDTSVLFVDAEQAGAAVVIAPGIRPYAMLRGYHHTSVELDSVTARARQIRPERTEHSEHRDHGSSAADPLLTALKTWLDAGDDRGRSEVRTSELHRALAPEMSARAFGEALAALGIPKLTGGGRRHPTRSVEAIRRAAT